MGAATASEERRRAFVDDLFEKTDWPDGGDLDGFDFQELCVKHGLLATVEVTEACGDNCGCAEYTDFPTTCYRRTELSRRTASVEAPTPSITRSTE